MCIQCEIADSLIGLHAKEYVTAKLNDEILNMEQIELLQQTGHFDDIMWQITDQGRQLVESVDNLDNLI